MHSVYGNLIKFFRFPDVIPFQNQNSDGNNTVQIETEMQSYEEWRDNIMEKTMIELGKNL